MIHILDGYIRTSEMFRVIQVFFGVPGSYGNSPGEVMGLIGPYGKGGGMPKGRWRARPPLMGPNWTRGRGRRPPCPFLLALSFPLSFSPTLKRKRIPTR